MKVIRIFLCLSFIINTTLVFSQTTAQVKDTSADSAENVSIEIPGKTVDPAANHFDDNSGDVGKVHFLTSLEYYLSLSVLIFGLIIIGLEIFLVRKKIISSDNVVKFIVVTLIITGTLFLITAGYNNNQIAPAIGLFGTIAGYLLGKASMASNNVPDEK